jgi:hypothetical protein
MMIEPAMPTPLEKNRNMVANASEQPKFLIVNHAPARADSARTNRDVAL